MTEIAFQLKGGPLAAHLARGRLPDDLLPSPRAAVLELLLSELVTNAVRHGGSLGGEWISVAITQVPGRLSVSVTDTGPGFNWHKREGGRPRDSGGFGLLLVDRLSTRWGIARTGESTTVWFELC